jgi:iron complex outermembrane receptor protein
MSKRGISKHVAALLAAGAAAALLPAVASAQETQFNVPARDLGNALTELARQSNREIYFSADLTRGLRAPALRGRMTLEDALGRLLAGSGLRYRLTSSGAIVIEPAPGEAVAGSAAAESGSAEPGQADVVVTGSRLRRQPGDEGPTPVTTFDRRRIDELGVSNIADVLNYLPQQPFSLNETTNLGGARQVRLRGLGSGTTLVLINGRRTVTSAIQAGQNFFDLNTIPLPAVERVEILSSSASAVYGADALGGVVNIVLRRAIDRPQIDLYYGAANGGAEERRASLSFGHAGERWNASVALDYFDRDFLFGTERPYTANQDYRPLGGLDRRSTVASLANITSNTAANLPGLNSRIAAVLGGSTGVGLTPASFVATAGQTNRESLISYFSITPKSRRYSAVGTFDYELTDGLTFFAEGIFRSSRDERRQTPPSLANGLVPANNPFNPFGVPVRVTMLLGGYGAQANIVESDFWRGVAGVTAHMGRWDGELSVMRIHETGTSLTDRIVNVARLNAALASSDPNTAFNPFQDGPGGSPALLASLLDPDRVSRFQSDALQAGFFVRGPLIDLPAGPLDIVFGAEARSEGIDVGLAGAAGITPVAHKRSTEAVFGEVRVPLVGRDMNVPLVRSLTATFAGRHDSYSDFGGTTNPEVGLEWRPVRDLLLRGSWGRSFRPPSLYQLYFPATSVAGNTADILRNNEVVPITTFIGGNSGLAPERAKALGAGALFTPGGPLNLRFGANWWRIRQELRIVTLSVPFVLANAALFPGRVVRQTPTPADIAAGLPGRLVSVDLSNVNSGLLNTSGIDFEVSGRLETAIGAFSLNAAATWVDYYRIADVPSQVPVDRVGQASPMNTVPRWRVVSTLGWSGNGASLAVTTRWTPGYADASTTNVRNGRRIPAAALFDLNGSIDLGRTLAGGWMTDGLVLRAGVQNLFDRAPDYSESGGSQGVDVSQIDVRQRFFYVGLSKRF